MKLPRSSPWGCTNEFLQQLVDASPTALIVCDTAMVVLGVNHEACELVGRTAEELVGQPVHATWGSDRLRAAIADLLENAGRGHNQVAVEGPVTVASAERWTRWTAGQLSDGDSARLLLVGRDITELRSLEQRRSADEALSRIVASCDSIQRAVPRLLRALCRTLGWDVGELWTVDAVAGVLRCDGVWAVAEVDTSRLSQTCAGATLGPGEGLPGAAWSRGRVAQLSSKASRPVIERAGFETALAFPIRGRDEIFGVVTLSSRRVRIVNPAMLEALESLGGQIGLLFDRIRARENLRRTEKALRTIHRIGTTSAASLESQLQELLREGCRWFGMDVGALVRSDEGGISPIAIVTPPGSGGDERKRSHDPSSSIALHWCEEIMAHDGEPVCIEDASSAPSGAAGPWQTFIGSPVRLRHEVFAVLGFWGTRPRRRRFSATDREILAVMAQWIGAEIERVRLQEQLVEGERLAAIGMTATTFAHEVSNPLNNMALACELVARELRSPIGGVESVLALVRKEVGRLGRLLEEFRALSRTQALCLEASCLSELVGSVLTDFDPMLTARGITCRLNGGLRVESSIDRDKMRQVLVNLVKNAIEAMPDGGVLTVSIFAHEDRARIEVVDTGCGVPDGVDVFAPFATTKREGTGLGLAVVRQLVAAHHGRVSFDTAPDRGTRFVVELPAVRRRERRRPSQTALSCSP
jgi:PAS domain S-box-containing protein